MAEITFIGKLIEEGAQRDAIHVAVAPVVAGERLKPGEHIGFEAEGDTEKVVSYDQGHRKAIGIVDPFLPRDVKRGERFWMFLYQHTITSLRHNWTHPAFSEENRVAPVPAISKVTSEAWLRDFIARADCPDYDTVIAAAIGDHDKNDGGDNYVYSKLEDYGDGSSYLYFGGSDAHGEIPDEFWDHVENVTGRKVPGRAKYFTCSC